MGNTRAIEVKARAILRSLGYSDGDAHREYKDWHIEIRSGVAYLSVWTSAGMVYLTLSHVPVYHRTGTWEQYLDLLFHRLTNGRGRERSPTSDLREQFRAQPEPSTEN